MCSRTKVDGVDGRYLASQRLHDERRHCVSDIAARAQLWQLERLAVRALTHMSPGHGQSRYTMWINMPYMAGNRKDMCGRDFRHDGDSDASSSRSVAGIYYRTVLKVIQGIDECLLQRVD